MAAVWFDELIILDPVGASLNSIGVDPIVSQALQLLRQEGILKIVDPATVPQTIEGPMAAAIRADLIAYAETGQAYDEIRHGPDGPVEYR